MVGATFGRRLALSIASSAISVCLPTVAFAASTTAIQLTSGATSISTATAGGVFTDMTGPIITTIAGNDITGTGGTVTLTLPAGFEFDTGGTAPTVLVTCTNNCGGGATNNINNLTSGSTIAVTVAATSLTITVTDDVDGAATVRNSLTWQNVRIRPLSGVAASTTLTRGGTVTISGAGTNFGTVSSAVPPSAPGAPDMTTATDSGTFDTDNITSDTTPTFTVTCTNGYTVRLYVGSTQVDSSTCTGGSENMTPGSAVADGTYSVTATQENASESAASSSLSVTIDTAAPNISGAPDLDSASDSGVSSSDNITNDDTPSFTATCDIGNYVQLRNNTTTVATVLCTTGTVSLTSSALTDGNKTMRTRQEDLAGNVSANSSNLAVTIDTAAPGAPSTPDLNPGSDLGTSSTDNITNDNTPSFTMGGCTNGNYIHLFDGSTDLGSVSCGVGTETVTSSSLSDGAYSLTAKESDDAGNMSSASGNLGVSIDTALPVITLLGTTPITITVGSVYTDSGATALDGAVNLTASIVTSNPVNTAVAGPYTVTYDVTDAAGNAALQVTRSVTVGLAVTTTLLTSDINPSVYGQNVTYTATVTGSSPTGTVQFYDGAVPMGAAVALSGGQAQLVWNDFVAASHNVTADYSGDIGNQTSTSNTFVQVVNPKAITVTPTAGQTKIYGDADPASFTYSNTALEFTDTLTGALARVAGENVGTFAFTIGTLSGGSNYTLSLAAETFAVSQKTVTITPTAGQTKTYGDTDPVFTYSNTALVGADTLTGALARAAGENVGSYAFNLGTLSGGSNYSLSLNAENFGITQKAITITPDAGQTKTYGDSDPALTYTSTPLAFSDSFSGALSRAAGENVASYAITMGTLDAGTNYSYTLAAENFSITQKAITVTPDASQSKTYGDSDPALTHTSTPLAFTDSFSGALSRAAGENVGSYAITMGTLDAGTNYSYTLAAENFTILQKAITITPDAGQTKVFGTSDPTLTYTSTPLAFTDSFSGALSRAAGENVGTYAITNGTLTAGSNYLETFAAENFTITQASTSTSTVLDTPTPNSTVGTAVELHATVTGVSPTGTVKFYSGAVLLNSVTISNGSGSIMNTFTQAGNYNLTAEYVGDSNHTGSTSASITVHIVDKDDADTVTTVGVLNPAIVGTSVNLTATVAGAYNPTGTIEFYDGAVLIGTGSLNGSFASTLAWTFTSAGTHSVTAHYLGDGNNNASISGVELVLAQVIDKDSPDTVTSVGVSDPSIVGDNVVFTATVTGAFNPTGTVEFYSGAVLLGSGSLAGTTATFNHTFTLVGSYSITAHYLGDSNNNASISAVEVVDIQTVDKASPTTSTVLTVTNPSTIGDTITMTATVNGGYNPSGTVEFYDDHGLTLLGSATLSSGTANFMINTLAVGSHSVSAVYVGDPNNNGSTSATVTVHVVQQMTSSTLFGTLPNPNSVHVELLMNVVITGFNPTGTVEFFDNGVSLGISPLIGTHAGFTSFPGLGSHSLTAVYSGDVNNTSSTSNAVQVQIVDEPDNNDEPNQGSGGSRGGGFSNASAVAKHTAEQHGYGLTAPPAFGGDDVPLNDQEIGYICSMQRSLRNAPDEVVTLIGGVMASFMGRSEEFVAEKLADESLCEEINAALTPKRNIAKAHFIAFPLGKDGLPVSSNDTWNACIRGSVTLDQIKNNPDRNEYRRAGVSLPKTCGHYHTGTSWLQPDLNMRFDFFSKSKGVILPIGYIPVMEKEVAAK